jgi:glycosyltransferase involved in cell wall biosynthesis
MRRLKGRCAGSALECAARKSRITFSAPGLNPSIEEGARALWDAGLLGEFCTTLALPENGVLLRAGRRLDLALRSKVSRHLERRSVSALPSGAIKGFPFWELARTVLSRLGADRRICDVVFDHGIRSFDRAVARRLQQSTAVYCYEYSAHETFRAAQRRGLYRIYEVPSLEHDFVERLIDREIGALGTGPDGHRAYFLNRQGERTRRRRAEWAMADLIVVHSNLARDSYREAGLPVDKVSVVPLGCPPPNREAALGGSAPGQALRVLWAGNFSLLKGAHHFLRALQNVPVPPVVDVHVFGQVILPAAFVQQLPDWVRFHGTVSRVELAREYARADVLMFPTLCDGFGMVLTEAMAQGLPVITTPRAGAADFIRHGENGLIVPPGDPEALVGAIRWCLDNRDRLKAMRANALETAASWQWADYRVALVTEVTQALAGR